ncbi:MAG: DinB family protein [Bryobacteraceae bacterium]|nr:DinB family protein [Bryobacteraceae bacterium]MDW8377070.1 DinB family protein [Bryobacterales bacterium]
MTPDQARFLFQLTLPELKQEAQLTQKVIRAIPEEQASWKPNEKGMNALDLAWHIVSSEAWFLEGIASGGFPQGGGQRPENVQTVAGVLAFYDGVFPSALEKLQNLSDEQLARTIDFFGIYQLPAVRYLGFVLKHSVHHRGQLTTYLRAMGAKVPSVYGGSADEPFQR